MILAGGGLNHKTKKEDGAEVDGRVFGYTHSDSQSARIDFSTGAPMPFPDTIDERPDQKLKFKDIYASLLKHYGFDYRKYYPDAKILQPLAETSARGQLGKPQDP